jgi:hypothetical protein
MRRPRLNHPVKATVLTFFDVERRQQRTRQTVLYLRQASCRDNCYFESACFKSSLLSLMLRDVDSTQDGQSTIMPRHLYHIESSFDCNRTYTLGCFLESTAHVTGACTWEDQATANHKSPNSTYILHVGRSTAHAIGVCLWDHVWSYIPSMQIYLRPSMFRNSTRERRLSVRLCQEIADLNHPIVSLYLHTLL